MKYKSFLQFFLDLLHVNHYITKNSLYERRSIMEGFAIVLLLIIIVLLMNLTILAGRIEQMLKGKKSDPIQPLVIPTAEVKVHTSPPPPVVSAPAAPSIVPPEPKKKNAFLQWLLTGSTSDAPISEYAIATTWLLRGGVMILLCAVGFFLKYSIENSLFPPVIRIIITYAAGLAMCGAGYYGLHKKFHIISIAVLSIGIVTLYMASFSGFRLYKIFSVETAFVLMVLTSAGAMFLSAKKELLPMALTGCAGAFLTPFMLSDGSGNIPFLLGYTAATSACILIVSRIHRWRSLEWEAWALNSLVIIAALVKYSDKVNHWCPLFLLAGYSVYTLIPIIRKQQQNNGVTEWLIPLLSVIALFLSGLCVLSELEFSGLSNRCANTSLALVIALITAAESLWLRLRRPDAQKIYPVYYCCTAVALAASVPLATNSAEWLAGTWSVLALILIYGANKTKEKILFTLGCILYVMILLFVLCPDPAFLKPDRISFIDRFFRGGMYTLSLFGAGGLLLKTANIYYDVPGRKYSAIYFSAGALSLLVYSSWEVYLNLKQWDALYEFRHGGLSVWWAIYAAIVLTLGLKKDWKKVRLATLVLFAVCLIKVYIIDIAGLNTLEKVIAFLLIGVLLIGGAAAYIISRNRKAADQKE